jgi:hypothetical protein
MKNFTKLSILILSASILFTSCASTTLINSTPSGAELYINEEAVGVTPYSMTDTKIVGSCSSIRIEKEGYNEFYTTICRTEEVDGGAVVGGFFFWPAWLWAMKYKSSHYYKLTPKTGEEESLEQLLNNNQSSGNKTIKNSDSDENGKTMDLNDATPISSEEFEKQKIEKASE